MEFFNKIGIDNYYDKSIFEKIDLLLKNNVFYVDECDVKGFKDSIELINLTNLKESNHNKEIVNIFQLRYNEIIADEIYQIVIKNIKHQNFPQTIPGVEAIDNYELEISITEDTYSTEEIIKDYLKKVSKLLSEFILLEFPFRINNKQLLDRETFYFLIKEFYQNTKNICEFDYSPIIELKEDIITHLTPEGPEPYIAEYKTAINFMVINDYLCIIDFFKKELKKVHHEQITRRGAVGSNYSTDNVMKNENRFPLVFKNAYYCELFLYTLSFYLDPKPIIFSYYYDLFKRQKLFKKGVQISDYLVFINNIYGLREVRLRKELSNKKDGFLLNEFLKREKDFKIKTLIKSTN